MALRNPRKLYDRQCAECRIDITTTYAPNRPERVLYSVLWEGDFVRSPNHSHQRHYKISKISAFPRNISNIFCGFFPGIWAIIIHNFVLFLQ